MVLTSFLQQQCKPILENVTREDLIDIIMPSVVKSLLRNPEGVLEGMLYVYVHMIICDTWCFEEYTTSLKGQCVGIEAV